MRPASQSRAKAAAEGGNEPPGPAREEPGPETVSYTHLTLPTIYSV